jgi:outer membrane protein assembly factor BamB
MTDVHRVQELLAYNPDTGVFVWKKTTSNRVKVGSVAGNMSKGYREISIDGKTYRAHRLAWLLTHGRWPSVYLDHVNGNPDDNRLCNLREASTSENAWNSRRHADNRSGLKGATYCRNRHHLPWQARICVNGKTKPLGWFATAEEAHRAYEKAARETFGQFARAS